MLRGPCGAYHALPGSTATTREPSPPPRRRARSATGRCVPSARPSPAPDGRFGSRGVGGTRRGTRNASAMIAANVEDGRQRAGPRCRSQLRDSADRDGRPRVRPGLLLLGSAVETFGHLDACQAVPYGMWRASVDLARVVTERRDGRAMSPRSRGHPDGSTVAEGSDRRLEPWHGTAGVVDPACFPYPLRHANTATKVMSTKEAVRSAALWVPTMVGESPVLPTQVWSSLVVVGSYGTVWIASSGDAAVVPDTIGCRCVVGASRRRGARPREAWIGRIPATLSARQRSPPPIASAVYDAIVARATTDDAVHPGGRARRGGW